MNALRLDRFQVSEIKIENTLGALQNEVGGYIEVVMLSDKAAMIVNEEGLLLGLSPNVIASAAAGTLIVGNALIVGVDGEDFTDVPSDIINRIKKKLPEGSISKI